LNVPPGTSEYQESVRKSKELLVRLNKGSQLLETAVRGNKFVEAQKLVRQWDKVSRELFTELELATILHQHMLTGNQVLLRSDGRSLVKVEDITDQSVFELDPWTLLSLEKLVTVFGPEVKNIIEFVDEPAQS
jgi:hypothetical protein